MTEPYVELGGLHRGDQWDERGAISRPCPDCGSDVGIKCTFEAEYYVPGLGLMKQRRNRHMPCKNRIINGGSPNE